MASSDGNEVLEAAVNQKESPTDWSTALPRSEKTIAALELSGAAAKMEFRTGVSSHVSRRITTGIGGDDCRLPLAVLVACAGLLGTGGGQIVLLRRLRAQRQCAGELMRSAAGTGR